MTRVQVKSPDIFVQRGVHVPGSLFATRPFKFSPVPFAIGNEYLKQKILQPEIQEAALAGFLEAPQKPCTYGIGSDPDPEKAKYFAAFLLEHYLKNSPNSLARWYGLHERTDLIKNDAPCSLLVITGCNPKMTQYRLEKCRDLIDHYENIPKLVVIGGEDPVTFFASRLHQRMTHLFYTPSNAVNRTVEVV